MRVYGQNRGVGQENLWDLERGIKDHWKSCSKHSSRLHTPFIIFESYYNLINSKTNRNANNSCP